MEIKTTFTYEDYRRTPVVLSDINVLQPDILFISRDRFGYQATGTFVSPSRLESPLLPGLNIDLERIF